MGVERGCESSIEIWRKNQLDLAKKQNLRLAGENLQLKEHIRQLEDDAGQPCKPTDKA